GTAVAKGAIDEIHALHLPYAGDVPYDAHALDAPAVVKRIASLKPDVLFVSAYLQDGVALRREMVREHLPLVANIGSSSSYCMPAFGAALGADVPVGGLPNGSGLRFAPPGASDAGSNLLAQGVIWEWTRPDWRDVVWPRQFATASLQPVSIGW